MGWKRESKNIFRLQTPVRVKIVNGNIPEDISSVLNEWSFQINKLNDSFLLISLWLFVKQ